jgi:hypothetical protein
MAGNGDPHAQSGCGIHLYVANRSMKDRYFYDADGELLIVPQQGRLRLATELGLVDCGAAGDRRGAREASGSGSNCRTVRRAATSVRTSGRRSGCRTSARSAPTDSPTLATSSRRSPGTRTSTATANWWPSSWATSGPAAMDHSPLDVVAWHGSHAPVQVRPAPLQRHRLDQLRPSRPVHLPGPAVTLGHPRGRLDRLRDLPAARAGDAGHVPAALVPSQHRERVHGPDHRCLRRQGGGVRPRWRQPAQLHVRARAGRRHVREGHVCGHHQAALHHRHARLHVRDAMRDPPHAIRAGVCPTPGGLLSSAGRDSGSTSIRPVAEARGASR